MYPTIVENRAAFITQMTSALVMLTLAKDVVKKKGDVDKRLTELKKGCLDLIQDYEDALRQKIEKEYTDVKK